MRIICHLSRLPALPSPTTRHFTALIAMLMVGSETFLSKLCIPGVRSMGPDVTDVL